MNLILTPETISNPAVVKSIYSQQPLFKLEITNLSFIKLTPYRSILKARLEQSPTASILINNLDVWAAGIIAEMLPSNFVGTLIIGKINNDALAIILTGYFNFLRSQKNGTYIKLDFSHPELLTDNSVLSFYHDLFIRDPRAVVMASRFKQPIAAVERAIHMIAKKKRDDMKIFFGLFHMEPPAKLRRDSINY